MVLYVSCFFANKYPLRHTK